MYETALATHIRQDIQAVRGHGGGGESPRTPIESPDSLRSIAYARIQDLISEGEIYGFADQSNPLSCIYLNETPIANADGSLNFKNVQVDSRVGTQTQDYMRGFDGVRNETAVGTELRFDTPWTRTFTNLNLDAVNVRLSVPMFTKTNTTNGDITGTSVYYMIQLSIDGGPFNTIMTGGFVGKTTTEYERGHRIDLPPATTSRTIRVQRLTEDSSSSALINNTYVKAFTEIVDVKLRMPMSAYVGTIVDAEQFTSIPSRAFHMKGRIIRVPSNYDPDTRTYDGVWDGTFQSRYSNNPAWVFYDMALNKRYGLGHLVPQQFMDKWALYRIAQYCDQLVPDGFGGMEPRFTCNIYLQVQNDALQVMQDLATVFRGIMYASGGAIVPVCDMPEDAVYTYTNANVIGNEFSYSGSGRKVRYTAVLASWNDMSDFCRAKTEYVPDEEGILRYGVQETQVIAIGSTSQGQAHRLARYMLATYRLETDSVSFSVGLDGLRCAPGKIINIADKLRAGKRVGGRIVSATSHSVVLDSLPEVTAGDTLIITQPDGTAAEYEIFSVTGAQVNIVDGFDNIPVPHSVWAVSTEEEPIVKYRVLGVLENEEGNGYTVHGIKHVSGKFAYADSGIKLDETPIPPVPGSVVPSPQNLEVTTRNVVEQNLVTKAATLSWDAVVVASSYNVQWRSNDGSWIDAGNNAATTREIYGIPAGPFEIQVVAIDSLGRRSLPTFGGPYDVITPDQPPGVIDDVRGELDLEIQARIDADFDVAAAAAIDATNKANAARDAAIAYADVIAAQLNDIIEADEWTAATNYVIGDIVQWDGKLYRAETDNINQQPDTNPDDWLLMGDYTSLGEAVAASITLATQAVDDTEALSTQLDAVIARMPAGTGELATQASVASEITARTSADSALATRLDVVEARMPAGTGQLATATALSTLTARVDAVEGVNTAQGSALTTIQARLPGGSGVLATGESVSLLDTRLTAAEGSISANSSAITTVNARLQGNIGGNRIKNPAFNNGSNADWNSSHGVVVVYSPRLGGYHLSHTTGAGERYICTLLTKDTWNFASVGEVSTFSATVNCDGPWRLAIQYRNDAGTVLQETSTPIQASTAGEWVRSPPVTSPAAPAGTTWWIAVLYATNTTSHHRIFHPKFELGAFATPYSEETATSANASAISLLDGRVTSAEGTLSAVSTALTQVRSELGGGGNILTNTGFEVDISTWTLQAAEGGWAGGSTLDRNLGGDSWRPIGMNNIGRYGGGSPTTGQVSMIRSDFVPVTAGKRYMLSAYIAAHRATAYMQIVWLNAAGDTVTGSTTSTVGNITAVISNGGQDLNNWSRCYTPNDATAVAPPGTYQCYVRMVAYGAGSANPYTWMVRPMLEEVGPQQTAPSKWAEGTGGVNTKYASITNSLQTQVTTAQSGVTTMYARWTLALDVNGYISGVRSENTGSTSTFDVLADKFRILKPGGGERFEYSDGNLRVYDSAGTLRVAVGVGI